MNEWCFKTSTVPVEGEHAACDGHVHWHLSRHPANHKHLLPCVGVEGWVVDVLGPPELILRQARFRFPSSETHFIMSSTFQTCLLTCSVCKINVSTQNWIFKLRLAPYWGHFFHWHLHYSYVIIWLVTSIPININASLHSLYLLAVSTCSLAQWLGPPPASQRTEGHSWDLWPWRSAGRGP